MEKVNKRKIYVAHDIEKAGCKIMAYPVVSVGFVVADDIDIISKHKFNILVKWYTTVAPSHVQQQFTQQILQNNDEQNDAIAGQDALLTVSDYGDFEKKTVDEFWNRVPIDTQEMRVNAKPANEAWADIAKFIDNLETEYPDAEIIFLTNNNFDTANIDYNLELYTKRQPMRFSTTGVYRKVINADDMFAMIPDFEQERVKKEICDHMLGNHDPVNDAHYIYEQYIYAQLWRGSHHEFEIKQV
jgi:galactitol-specific phosphotransferase system IIB component